MSEYLKKQIEGKNSFKIEKKEGIVFNDIRGEVLEVVCDYLNHKVLQQIIFSSTITKN